GLRPAQRDRRPAPRRQMPRTPGLTHERDCRAPYLTSLPYQPSLLLFSSIPRRHLLPISPPPLGVAPVARAAAASPPRREVAAPGHAALSAPCGGPAAPLQTSAAPLRSPPPPSVDRQTPQAPAPSAHPASRRPLPRAHRGAPAAPPQSRRDTRSP